MTGKDVNRPGVVGCRPRGSNIVETGARAGPAVRVVEMDEAALMAERRRVESSLRRAVKAGKLSDIESEGALDRVEFSSDLESLADSDLVVEVVLESEPEKLEIFAALDRVVTSAHAVLASNTSSIPIMKLAMATARPSQVVGIHFFNTNPSRLFKSRLPSSPALPGSGCLQHHRTAATVRRGGSLTRPRIHGAA